jgi:hypothetical protein
VSARWLPPLINRLRHDCNAAPRGAGVGADVISLGPRCADLASGCNTRTSYLRESEMIYAARLGGVVHGI